MGNKTGRILVVDDNIGIRKTLELILPRHFEDVKTISSPGELISEIRNFKPDVVLLDMNFKSAINSGNEGLYWIKEIKQNYPYVEVVLFTAYGDIQLAVEGMKLGAYDFLTKPWENENLISTLHEAVAKGKGKKPKVETDSHVFWGDSLKMGKVRELIDKIAPTDMTVLLMGENGVGKDVMANELHKKSLRSGSAFVAVDMGAITETLFESELFGHLKGAFTGAVSNHKGKFEQAQGGTLFLDEIGNLPLSLQAKLLRVIQNRTVTPVGGDKEIPVDVRIICATNKNLKEEVENGNFREDLYYRISGFPILIPPLRERKEEIKPLAFHFLNIFNTKYHKKITDFDSQSSQYLLENQWSGNIRELKGSVEKAVILADGEIIKKEDLAFGETTVQNSGTTQGDEKSRIAEVLAKTDGNISKAAKLLNMSRPTLYSKINKYHL